MFEENINIDKLSIGYRDGNKSGLNLLANLNLSCKKGESTGLVGRNGTGKSTLLKTLAGLLNPLDGNVFIHDVDLSMIPRKELARRVSFVSTEVPAVQNLKVIELVCLGRYPYTDWTGRLSKTDREFVNLAVEQAGIGHILEKFISEISDGERQRAMIARALAQNTEIIILDEPTAFLDLPSRFEILRLLNHLAAYHKKTIIFSTHDLSIALHEADNIWLIHDRHIFTGAPEDLIINKGFIKLFENSTLDFDDDKGEIKPKRSFTCEAGLNGEGMWKMWTGHAMERIGIKVVDSHDKINISVNQMNGNPVWNIVFDANESQTESIYELCLRLKSIINKKI